MTADRGFTSGGSIPQKMKPALTAGSLRPGSAVHAQRVRAVSLCSTAIVLLT